MKTTFYIMRHGESHANFHRVFIGRTDAPLTERGREQAMKAGTFMEEHREDYPIDRVFASPLSRAYETASLATEYTALPVTNNHYFMEIWGGKWENERFEDLPDLFPDDFYRWKNDIGRSCPTDGESVLSLGKRVFAGLEALAKRYPGEHIFIGTHATPLRTLYALAMCGEIEKSANYPWPTNASLSVFALEDGVLTCEDYARDDYLLGMNTALPKNI